MEYVLVEYKTCNIYYGDNKILLGSLATKGLPRVEMPRVFLEH